MKNDVIDKYFDKFFEEYLCYERGVSDNTLRAYAHTVSQLLKYITKVKKIGSDRITLTMINKQLVLEYLRWLQDEKHASASTCNQRLAVISTFAKYMSTEDVAHFSQWIEITKIKTKKAPKTPPSYLSEDELRALFATIPQDSIKGRRDLALLTLLYESGARVQEIIDLTPSALHMTSKPFSIRLHGKGNKTRIVPLSETPCKFLMRYMAEHGLDRPENNCKPLFTNNRGGNLSEAGINYIITQYVESARKDGAPTIPAHITPHSFRHTRAMHLLNKGMNLIYIRDILGHVSIKTTEIYARISSTQRESALKNAYTNVSPEPIDYNIPTEHPLIEKLKKYGKKLS
jgi:site-specific recombinase XerD